MFGKHANIILENAGIEIVGGKICYKVLLGHKSIVHDNWYNIQSGVLCVLSYLGGSAVRSGCPNAPDTQKLCSDTWKTSKSCTWLSEQTPTTLMFVSSESSEHQVYNFSENCYKWYQFLA